MKCIFVCVAKSDTVPPTVRLESRDHDDDGRRMCLALSAYAGCGSIEVTLEDPVAAATMAPGRWYELDLHEIDPKRFPSG